MPNLDRQNLSWNEVDKKVAHSRMFVHKKRKETPASSNEGHTDEQERITNVTDVSDFFTRKACQFSWN